MKKSPFNYIYGPVYSWRLGMSLGIDPLSTGKKICNFNCVYCQLGPAVPCAAQRRCFVPTQRITRELRALPHTRIDYLTFSGAGEPTLAKNLGAMIRAARKVRKEKIAVITNGSLLNRADVRRDLALADFVLVKIDAATPTLFQKVNKPGRGNTFADLIQGLTLFRKMFQGKLGLQAMFVSANRREARAIAKLAQEFAPDEVQINTPLRQCAVKPLTRGLMRIIAKAFREFRVRSVYDFGPQKAWAFDEKGTVSRHGKPKNRF